MKGTSHAARQAFTLVELLASIVVIAVLVALTFGGIAALRDHGNSAKCMGNMRGIFAGIQAYAQDNNNRLMQRYYGDTRTGYDELLAPYLPGAGKALFTCPSQKKIQYPEQPGYGMNWFYDNQPLTAIDKPSQTILLAEAVGDGRQVGSHRADRDSRSPGQLDKTRHRRHANYLFFDGHVAPMRYEETRETIGAAIDSDGGRITVDMWGVDHEDHSRRL